MKKTVKYMKVKLDKKSLVFYIQIDEYKHCFYCICFGFTY